MKKLIICCLTMVLGMLMCLGPIGIARGGEKIILWSLHKGRAQWDAYVEEQGDKFAQLHPEVKGVDVINAPYGTYQSKYITAFLGKKDAPDIFCGTAHQWAGLFDFADPMPEDFAQKVDQEVSDECRLMGVYAGKRYGIPREGANFMMMYINVDMFEQAGLDPNAPPQNFDELLEYAKELAVYGADGEITRSGLCIRYGGNPLGVTDKFLPYFYGMGGRIAAPDFSTATGYLNSPESLDALTYYVDLVLKWKVSSTKLGFGSQAFAKKLGAMMFREGHYPGYLRDNAPDIRYKVYPVPENENSLGPNVHTLPAWAYHVYRYSPRKDLAWEFLKFMWTPERVLGLAASQEMLPTMEELLDTEYVRSRPYYEAMVETLARKPYAPHYYHPTMMNMVFDVGGSILDALFGNASPEAALEMATTRLNLVLEKH